MRDHLSAVNPASDICLCGWTRATQQDLEREQFLKDNPLYTVYIDRTGVFCSLNYANVDGFLTAPPDEIEALKASVPHFIRQLARQQVDK